MSESVFNFRRGRAQIASSLAPPPGHTRQIQIEQQQNGAFILDLIYISANLYTIFNIDLFLIKLIYIE